MLAQKGLIEDGAVIRATAAGIAALGSGYEPLPVGDELRSYWLGRLPDGERAVLEQVIDVYPETADRDAIGEATGYKRSTRNAYIARLAVRKLIEINSSGVRASDMLFG